MAVSTALHQFEPAAEDFSDRGCIVAYDWQAAAALGAIGSRSRYDRAATRANRPRNALGIGSAVVRIRQEANYKLRTAPRKRLYLRTIIVCRILIGQLSRRISSSRSRPLFVHVFPSVGDDCIAAIFVGAHGHSPMLFPMLRTRRSGKQGSGHDFDEEPGVGFRPSYGVVCSPVGPALAHTLCVDGRAS
jgi:hypothetical protein